MCRVPVRDESCGLHSLLSQESVHMHCATLRWSCNWLWQQQLALCSKRCRSTCAQEALPCCSSSVRWGNRRPCALVKVSTGKHAAAPQNTQMEVEGNVRFGRSVCVSVAEQMLVFTLIGTWTSAACFQRGSSAPLTFKTTTSSATTLRARLCSQSIKTIFKISRILL